jgi:hypothetical protein
VSLVEEFVQANLPFSLHVRLAAEFEVAELHVMARASARSQKIRSISYKQEEIIKILLNHL